MAMARTHDETDGFIGLVRETADGLGHLIADHIKLARVEMVADAKEYGRRMAVLAAAGAVVVVGYLFAWIAAAIALGRVIGSAAAFLAVALVHLVAGAVAFVVVGRKLKDARVMDETVSEVGRSVATLRAQVAGAEPQGVGSP